MRYLFCLYILLLPAIGVAVLVAGSIWFAAGVLAIVGIVILALHLSLVRCAARKAEAQAATKMKDYMEVNRASKPAAPLAGIRHPHAE